MTDSITPDIPQKQCAGTCQQWLPATPEFFYADPSVKSGLYVTCKACAKARAKARYAALHPHRKREHVEGMKCCPTCGELFSATPEFFYRAANKKNGLHGQCKTCWKAHDIAHREQHRLSRQARYQAHREEYRQKQRVRTAATKEQRRQWNIAHRAQNAERARRYRKAHPELLSALDRAHKHKRKAQKKAIGGSYTAWQLQEQLQRQKAKCYYCKAKLEGKWHADHIVPLSKGGSNDISNIVIACPECNMKKGAKFPHEWDGGCLL